PAPRLSSAPASPTPSTPNATCTARCALPIVCAPCPSSAPPPRPSKEPPHEEPVASPHPDRRPGAAAAGGGPGHVGAQRARGPPRHRAGGRGEPRRGRRDRERRRGDADRPL